MPETIRNCPDCGVKPGKSHKPGCDVERCSHCGGQAMICGCKEHDEKFARWTGLWPGDIESKALGMDLNTFHSTGTYKFFFVKPKR